MTVVSCKTVKHGIKAGICGLGDRGKPIAVVQAVLHLAAAEGCAVHLHESLGPSGVDQPGLGRDGGRSARSPGDRQNPGHKADAVAALDAVAGCSDGIAARLGCCGSRSGQGIGHTVRIQKTADLRFQRGDCFAAGDGHAFRGHGDRPRIDGERHMDRVGSLSLCGSPHQHTAFAGAGESRRSPGPGGAAIGAVVNHRVRRNRGGGYTVGKSVIYGAVRRGSHEHRAAVSYGQNTVLRGNGIVALFLHGNGNGVIADGRIRRGSGGQRIAQRLAAHRSADSCGELRQGAARRHALVLRADQRGFPSDDHPGAAGDLLIVVAGKTVPNGIGPGVGKDGVGGGKDTVLLHGIGNRSPFKRAGDTDAVGMSVVGAGVIRCCDRARGDSSGGLLFHRERTALEADIVVAAALAGLAGDGDGIYAHVGIRGCGGGRAGEAHRIAGERAGNDRGQGRIFRIIDSGLVLRPDGDIPGDDLHAGAAGDSLMLVPLHLIPDRVVPCILEGRIFAAKAFRRAGGAVGYRSPCGDALHHNAVVKSVIDH